MNGNIIGVSIAKKRKIGPKDCPERDGEREKREGKERSDVISNEIGKYIFCDKWKIVGTFWPPINTPLTIFS